MAPVSMLALKLASICSRALSTCSRCRRGRGSEGSSGGGGGGSGDLEPRLSTTSREESSSFVDDMMIFFKFFIYHTTTKLGKFRIELILLNNIILLHAFISHACILLYERKNYNYCLCVCVYVERERERITSNEFKRSSLKVNKTIVLS